MDSLPTPPASWSWLRSPKPRAASVGRGVRYAPRSLRLEALEDRTVPSSSIPLSGTGFKPIGGTIAAGGAASTPDQIVAGRVTSIASQAIPFNPANPTQVAPTDPADPNFAAYNTYYAGTPGGGVAKTTDGGLTWKFLTDNLPTQQWGDNDLNRNLSVGAVAVSPFNSNLVLAGLGEGFAGPYGYAGTGLLRSTDGGSNWRLIKGPQTVFGQSAFDAASFQKFVFHPSDPNIIFALVNNYLSVSQPNDNVSVSNTTPTIKSSNLVSGVYRSVDGGETWANVSTGITGGELTRPISDFLLDPTNPSVAYIALPEFTAGGLTGVFRTQNFLNPSPVGGVTTPQPAGTAITFTNVLGGTGTQVPPTSLDWIKLAFALGNNAQPSRVYVIAAEEQVGKFNPDQLYRSDDSGVNFRRLDPIPSNPYIATRLPPYNLQIVADPTNPNRVFFGGRDGNSLTLLTNGDFNPDLGQTPNYVALTPATGTPGIIGPTGTLGVIRDLRFDNTGPKDTNGRPLQPGRLLFATDAGVFRLQAPGNAPTTIDNFINNSLALVSLNGAPGPNSLNIQQFFSTALAPRDDNRALGGTYLNGQAIFTDAGPFDPASTNKAEVANYNNVFNYGLSGGASLGSGGNIVYSPINPNFVYRVSTSSNANETIFFPDTAYQFNPTADPGNTAIGLFQRSTDGGLTWTTSTSGISDPLKISSVTPLAIDPAPQVQLQESRLFLGTGYLNISQNGGQSWSHYGKTDALPFVTSVNSEANVAPEFKRRNPRITAIGTSLNRTGVVVVAVDRRENGSGASLVLEGPALYAVFEGPPIFPGTVGSEWYDISPGVGGPIQISGMGAPMNPLPNNLQGHVLQIINDPTDYRVLTVITDSTGAGRVLRSTNFGSTWLDITGDLPAASGDQTGLSLFSIAIDPNQLGTQSAPNFADDNIYLGTTLGVWKLTDPTSATPTWVRFGGTGQASTSTGTPAVAGAIPDVQVRDVELNTTTGVLSAATFGRGIWQLQIRPFVRGRVFNDVNGDGLRDTTTDTPIAGAVALAFRNSAVPPAQFANTTTTATGEYVFRSLPTDNYSFSAANASNLLIDTGTKYFATSNPIAIDANPATVLNGQDIFVFQRATVSGRVYNDLNGNGKQDAGEGGAAGYPVVLFAPAGTLDPTNATPVATVTSDANGNYTFAGVGPLRPNPTGASTPFAAGYQVSVSKAGTQVTQQPGTTGALLSAAVLTDAANANVTRVGVFQFGQISGTVFTDANGDGVFANEVGRAGVTVTLVNADTGAKLATTVSGAGGAYSFGDLTTGLGAGRYAVTVTTPAGSVVTSAPLSAVGVVSGSNATGFNVGLFDAASIAGTAYDDPNGNGQRDPGENTTLANVSLSLINAATNSVVATAVTNGSGAYTFAGLFPIQRPGNTVPYLVRFAGPTATFTQSSVDRSVILSSGKASTNQNVELFRATTVRGFAFDDTNGNGVLDAGEKGLAGGVVQLLNATTGAAVYTTAADGSGNFVFSGVGPIQGGTTAFRLAVPAGIFLTTPEVAPFFVTSGTPVTNLVVGEFRPVVFSGIVFEDLLGDGFTSTDPRLPGQTVQLLNAAGAVAGSAVTDINGFYQIGTGPGTYRAREVVPAGFVQTTPNPGAVAATSGATVTDQNFGDFRLITVSGRVFNDLNGDGLAGASEPGFGGVTVQLVGAATGAVAASTVTDGNGNYSFNGVGPGNYRLQTVNAGRINSTAPSLTFQAVSGQNVGFNFGLFGLSSVSGLVFEDIDRSGAPSAGDASAPGFTVQLVNAANAVVATQVTAADGSFNFGGLNPGGYTARVLPQPGYQTLANGVQSANVTSGQALQLAPVAVLRQASVAGTVFLDLNRNGRRDSSDRGLAGGTVALFDGAGTLLQSVTTDASGAYTFTTLPAGTYSVQLTASPGGFIPLGGTSTSASVTLALGSTTPGNALSGIDFGLTGRKRFAVAADGGGGPRVQVYDALTGLIQQDFFAYEQTFTGGVRVSEGDVNGDGVDDLVVVAGKGGGPRVRVFDGVSQAVIRDYFAYEDSFRNGLYVTTADVNGDGFADIITGTDSGGGPRVTVASGQTGGIIADFFAFDSNFRGGVRVGAGDISGTGVAQILATPGVGGAPVVAAFSVTGPQPTATGSFNAFDGNYTGGLYVTGSTGGVGGRSSIIVGTGLIQPEANVNIPTVRIFDGISQAPTGESEAFPATPDGIPYTGEARVSSFDRNGDGVPDIAVSSGPGSRPRLRYLDGTNLRQIGDEVQPYETGFLGGVFLG